MKATLDISLYMVVAAMLSACAGANNPALFGMNDKTVGSVITAQKTRKDDIQRLLGSAQEIAFKENGYEIWIYKDYNASAAAVNNILQYVPLLPTVRGTADIIPENTKKELIVLFDRSGVVQKYRVATW